MPLPRRAGAGLKSGHVCEILRERPDVGFFEVHAENYMGDGGRPHADLAAVRERYPLSIHGVALSIGGEEPLDRDHLGRLGRLVDRYEPASFSEHLAWSSHDGVYFNDLLPVAYDRATLDRVCDHIDETQDALGLRMLLENPSTYVALEASTMTEAAFLGEIVRRTGCGLLLDVNNLFVSATNHGRCPDTCLAELPLHAVGEIHLGGHAVDSDDEGRPLLIDAHDRPVADPVWALYRALVARIGPMPTLVEWDNDVPAWCVLRDEVERADAAMADAAREGRRDAAA